MLTLESALILPWDAFWVRGELTEAEGYPGITFKVFPKPVDVVDFHLCCGHGGRSLLKDLISLSANLPHLLVLVVIEDGFPELEIISVVVRTRHVFNSLRLLVNYCVNNYKIIINILGLIY